MSEPLFDREKHLNLIKPKPKGILQFGTMQQNKNLFAQTQHVEATNKDTLIPSLENNSRKKAIMAILAASNKKNEREQMDKIP
jgi:hypothetical protein